MPRWQRSPRAWRHNSALSETPRFARPSFRSRTRWRDPVLATTISLIPDHAPSRIQDLGPDRELVARLLASEDDAWEDFRQRFLPRIGACVRRAGVWVNDIEDACSFVLEALLDDDYHRLRQWDGRASLSTYLFTVASRLAVDFIRQQPRVIFAGEDAIPHAAPVGPAVLEAEERALHAGLREQILL